MTDRNRRRTLGIYYTPPEAAKMLARWAIRHREDIMLEPSFGGCSMLSAAVDIFHSLGNECPSNNLYGYDVDSTAFKHLANLGIENSNKHFKKQDFLQSKAEEIQVDAVLANPPFVSYHRLNQEQRQIADKIRLQYLPDLPVRASLWAHFLLHSLSYLRPGGRMAFVLPNAIGNADYARPLLGFLQAHFKQVELVHVSERLFIQAGADERISLLFLCDYAPDGYTNLSPLNSRSVASINEIMVSDTSVVQLVEHSKTPNIREESTAALIDLKNSALRELGSVASIHIGEVVGDVRFFVRPLSEWVQRKVDPKYLMPLLTRSAQERGIFIPKDSLNDGRTLVPYLLLPPEGRLTKGIEKYLADYAKTLLDANKTFGKRPIWYRCSYTTEADAFIGSMSHDYPRIIGNEAGISCSNAFYKIILFDRPELAAWLPILSFTTPLRLSAEVLGRVRGSGGIKLEPSDVRQLCIPIKLPSLPKAEFKALRSRIDNMVRNGELDAAGQLADSLIYLQPGLIDARTMSKLRLMRLSLTSHRIENRVANLKVG